MIVGSAHLTYCTNIHPGESWAEVRANLETHVLAVKQRVCPDAPFGVGLRLSARAAAEVDPPELRRWLDAHGLYVFTINGFPYGPFHGTPVKQQVYRPDWHEPERVAYTDRLADILVALLPDGVPGTISTVPGCFQDRAGDPEVMANNLARCAAHLESLARDTGKQLMLALEPEPCCVIETLAQAVSFFESHALDRRYLGLCLDVCHAAVEYEQLDAALAALRAANIAIAKVQLGCGLRVAPVDATARAALAPFAEGVYLHQVVARRGGELRRFVDLPDALADLRDADEWRVHFHVPVCRDAYGALGSTQAELAAVLAEHARAPLSAHLEVETYTWDVLPAEYHAEPIADAIARELRWVIDRLTSSSSPRPPPSR